MHLYLGNWETRKLHYYSIILHNRNFFSHGRQKVFYFAVIATSLGRILSIMVTSSFIWFAVGIGIAGFAVSSVFMSPFIISMEISSE